MKTYAAALVALGIFGLASGWSGCARSGADAAGADAAAAANGEKRYPLTGQIVRVEPKRNVLVVQHEDIKGLMPAMTMEFAAAAGDVAIAKPGEHIRADLVRTKDGEFHLERIWPDDTVAKETVKAGALQLRQDTVSRGRGAYREIGEQVPQFALYDQDGRVVQSARFGGKQIMLNFIYTRCPIASMCPAATTKMMATQRLAREAGVKNLELVSISFEPDYDTPGVLKEYAEARHIDTSNFSFLTGPESAIKDLLSQFGVIAEFDGPIAKHTLATLLIDEDGKIIYRADGSQWEPKEFVARMRKA